jgi:amphiphysin
MFKLMSQHGHTGLGRTPSSASGSTLGRRTSGLNKPPVAAPVRTPSSSSKFAPAPPLAPTVAAPPAYSPPPASAAAGAEDHYANAATKRAPPPPPPLKAKPSYAAEPKYVVALFDFEAQVRLLSLPSLSLPSTVLDCLGIFRCVSLIPAPRLLW